MAFTGSRASRPPDILCERCWAPVLPGQGGVRFGHIAGSTLTGDITWAWTYLHRYDRDEGCVRGDGPEAPV